MHTLLKIRAIPDPIMKGRDDMNIFQNKDSFFGCPDCELTEETADEGFRTGGDLQGLLFHVLDGTESQPQSPHPLYPRMKEILLSMLIS